MVVVVVVVFVRVRMEEARFTLQVYL